MIARRLPLHPLVSAGSVKGGRESAIGPASL